MTNIIRLKVNLETNEMARYDNMDQGLNGLMPSGPFKLFYH